MFVQVRLTGCSMRRVFVLADTAVSTLQLPSFSESKQIGASTDRLRTRFGGLSLATKRYNAHGSWLTSLASDKCVRTEQMFLKLILVSISL